MKHKLHSVIAIICLLTILILYFLHPVTNLVGDLGYYLTIGEYIVTNHVVPQVNVFSYTHSNYPFINMNWLAEVIFYLIHKQFGFNGLIFLALFLSIATYGLLFWTAARKYTVLPTFFLSLLSLQILYERTDIKPELFSYIFLAIFLVILYRFKQQFTKLIYLLPVISLIWTNTHLYFFLSIVVLLFFLIELAKEEKFKMQSKKARTLSLVTLLSISATFINPFFYKGALYPFFVLDNYGFKVAENIDFLTAIGVYQDPTFIFFGFASLFILLGLLFYFSYFSLVEILLIVFFTFLGFFAVRMFPLFVIGTFIPGVHLCWIIVDKLKKRYGNKTENYLLYSFFILVCLLIPTIKTNLTLTDSQVGLSVIDHAEPAVTFLKENNLHGPFYNNYNIGSYLTYHFYPQEKVFADARPEAYPKEFFKDIYTPIMVSPNQFTKYANIYRFNIIIFQYTEFSQESNQFLATISKNPQWKLVFLNSEVLIFIKDTIEHQEIIKNNLITEKNAQIRPEDSDTKNKVGNFVNLFRTIGWKKPWLDANRKYLVYEPENCNALQNIAFILQQEKHQEFEFYLQKYVAACKN